MSTMLRVKFTEQQREDALVGQFPYQFSVNEKGQVVAYYHDYPYFRETPPDLSEIWEGPLPVDLAPDKEY